jgi:hypothetical protein
MEIVKNSKKDNCAYNLSITNLCTKIVPIGKNITNQQITPLQLEIGVLLEHYNFLWSNAPRR